MKTERREWRRENYTNKCVANKRTYCIQFMHSDDFAKPHVNAYENSTNFGFQYKSIYATGQTYQKIFQCI